MIRKLLLIAPLFLFSISKTSAQGFWNFYGQGRLNDCIITTDTSILAVGNGFFVMKTDLSGDTIWTRTYPGTGGISGVNEAYSVTETPDHYYLVCGYSGNLTTSVLHFLKIDHNGNIIWNKIYGPGTGTCVKVNKQGLYIMTIAGDVGSSNITVSEFDTSGNFIWTKDTSLLVDDRAWGLELDSHDNIFVTGLSQSSTVYEGFVIKFDSSGVISHSHSFQSYANALFDITKMNDSTLFACGRKNTSQTDWGTWIIKLNSTGDTDQTIILPYQFEGWGIQYNFQLNLIGVVGFGLDSNQNSKNVYLAILDTSLNLLQINQIDTLGDDYSFGFSFYNNKIFVAGYSDSPNFIEDQWLYMFDNITDVSAIYRSNFASFFYDNKLFLKNYAQITKCILYNIYGEEVKQMSINKASGIIDLNGLPEGNYIAVFINRKKEIESSIKIVLTF